MSDKYVVYFDSHTSCGWLYMSNHDTVVFCHGMCSADIFDSEEDARNNAEEYLKRMHDYIDSIDDEKYTKEKREESKNSYHYWILRIDEKMAGELHDIREEGKKKSEKMWKEFEEKMKVYRQQEQFVSYNTYDEY